MARPQPMIAFRLTQLGTVAAEAFGERIGPWHLSRPQAGLLHFLAAAPGTNQRRIAQTMGMPASRLVALLDDLEERDLVQRLRNPDDRREHGVYLTADGEQVVAELRQVSLAHEQAMTAALTPAERTTLDRLLLKLAEAHGLQPGIHPGYRTL